MEKSTEQVSSNYLKLNSCGIQKLWDRDYLRIREHGRADYHIIYILQGKCTAESEGRETVLECGDMILFMPGEKQKYAFCAAERPISAYLHFTGTGCENLMRDIGFADTHVLRMKKSHILASLFEKITDEYSLKLPFYNEKCIAYLIEIFAEVGRNVSYMNNPAYMKNKFDIKAVCSEMLHEYSNRHPVEYYADFCHLSVSRFYHIFKIGVGLTPTEYINRLRINQAKELLANTDMSVSEIAESVGFTDQNYFGRVFKQLTGTSPKRFLKENNM